MSADAKAMDMALLLMHGDALDLERQVALVQLREGLQRKLVTYNELCSAVQETVALGLCAFTTELGSSLEVMHKRYETDANFRHSVASISAELMRIFDSYEPSRS